MQSSRLSRDAGGRPSKTTRRLAVTAGGLAALGIAGYKLYERLQEPGNTFFGQAFTGLGQGYGVVALTFDDGPNGANTSAILDVLKEEGVRATFFLVGMAVEREPEVLARMAWEGHALGIHGWSHARWNFLRTDALHRELAHTEAAIRDATGLRTHLVRPPFGARSFRVLGELQKLDYTCVLWSVPLALEWKATTPQTITRTILSRAHDGSIIVLHDGDRGRAADRSAVAQAVRAIVSGLRERGLRFVTIPEMLALPAPQ